MRSSPRRRASIGSVILVATAIVATAVIAGDPPPSAPEGVQIGTAFTYQGELSSAGAPASGTFEMSFAMWSAETGGGLVGTRFFPAVDVQDGRFTVSLDFGADSLGSGERWLEITVEGFTLAPRQPVMPAPFAIKTRGIDVNTIGNVGIGITASPGTTKLRVWKQVESGRAIDALATDAAALHAVAESQGEPTIYAENLDPFGSAIEATVDGGQRRVELATPDTAVRAEAPDTVNDWVARLTGRSYLGEQALVGREDRVTTSEFFGVRAPVTGQQYGGMYVSTDGANARPFYGYAPAGVARAWTMFDGDDQTWKLFVNGFPRLLVDNTGPRSQTGVPMPVAVAQQFGTNTAGSGPISIDRVVDGQGTKYVVSVGGVDFTEDVAVVHLTPLGNARRIGTYAIRADGNLDVYFEVPATQNREETAFSIVIWTP